MSDKLTALLADLQTATAALDEAEHAEKIASSEATDRRNWVNTIQKAIDAEMLTLRANAKWNTEWHSQRAMERAVQVG